MTSLSKIIKSANAFEVESTVMLSDVSIPAQTPDISGQEDDDCAAEQKRESLDIDLQLAQVKTMGEAILSSAKIDADRLMAQTMETLSQQRESMLREVTAQAEKIRLRAYEQGRAEGMQNGLNSFDNELTQINTMVSQLQDKQAEQLALLEDSVATFALEIAEKILNKQIQQDECEMEELVRAAIAAGKERNNVTVELSQAMPQLISSLQQKLYGLNTSCETVELRAVDLPAGTCRIESPDGIVDASIWVQLENLKAQLEDIGQ
ncbi:FliH/SctL family protein [Hydrogenoanaerobacterium sp.]|uniref:FliH/SctL family protein n=1 Tax=Hydrogenoanaerobacterium sp. TaxID=2953763 RepID=UPI00289CE908|nr:FliH/SctL family protein [Hydrogenoanaerobacterium sp.]